MSDRRAGADLAQASRGPARRRAAPGSDRGTRRTVPARSAGSSCGRAHSTHCTRTHSVSRCGGADRERARGGTRWRTDGALLRPPPPRLVAISRRLTSRRRRHGCDVINGTSHGPPAAASPRRPPEPALTAPLVRAGAFIRPRRPRPTATSFLPHSVRAFHGQTRASICLTSTITMANIRHSTNTILSRGKIFTIRCIVDDVLPL